MSSHGPNNSAASRHELLRWVNTVLELGLTRIEQLGSGCVFCQLLDAHFEGIINISKVDFTATHEHENLRNWKIFQAGLAAAKIKAWDMDVPRLSKGSIAENLDVLRRLFKQLQGIQPISGYQPSARRASTPKGDPIDIPLPVACQRSSFRAFSRTMSTPSAPTRMPSCRSSYTGKMDYSNVPSRWRESLAPPCLISPRSSISCSSTPCLPRSLTERPRRPSNGSSFSPSVCSVQDGNELLRSIERGYRRNMTDTKRTRPTPVPPMGRIPSLKLRLPKAEETASQARPDNGSPAGSECSSGSGLDTATILTSQRSSVTVSVSSAGTQTEEDIQLYQHICRLPSIPSNSDLIEQVMSPNAAHITGFLSTHTSAVDVGINTMTSLSRIDETPPSRLSFGVQTEQFPQTEEAASSEADVEKPSPTLADRTSSKVNLMEEGSLVPAAANTADHVVEQESGTDTDGDEVSNPMMTDHEDNIMSDTEPVMTADEQADPHQDEEEQQRQAIAIKKAMMEPHVHANPLYLSPRLLSGQWDVRSPAPNNDPVIIDTPPDSLQNSPDTEVASSEVANEPTDASEAGVPVLKMRISTSLPAADVQEVTTSMDAIAMASLSMTGLTMASSEIKILTDDTASLPQTPPASTEQQPTAVVFQTNFGYASSRSFESDTRDMTSSPHSPICLFSEEISPMNPTHNAGSVLSHIIHGEKSTTSIPPPLARVSPVAAMIQRAAAARAHHTISSGLDTPADASGEDGHSIGFNDAFTDAVQLDAAFAADTVVMGDEEDADVPMDMIEDASMSESISSDGSLVPPDVLAALRVDRISINPRRSLMYDQGQRRRADNYESGAMKSFQIPMDRSGWLPSNGTTARASLELQLEEQANLSDDDMYRAARAVAWLQSFEADDGVDWAATISLKEQTSNALLETTKPHVFPDASVGDEHRPGNGNPELPGEQLPANDIHLRSALYALPTKDIKLTQATHVVVDQVELPQNLAEGKGGKMQSHLNKISLGVMSSVPLECEGDSEPASPTKSTSTKSDTTQGRSGWKKAPVVTSGLLLLGLVPASVRYKEVYATVRTVYKTIRMLRNATGNKE